MEGGSTADHLRMSLEPATALGLNLLQFVQRGEDAVGERFVGKRPQPFCRLQFWRMRGQEQQVQAFWDDEIDTLMPTGLIQNQQKMFGWPGALFLGKGGQSQRKGDRTDGGHQQPTGSSALGFDKAIDIHPLVALPDHCAHARSLARPDAPQDGFEADAVFILTPYLNLSLWVLLLQLFHLFGQFF